MFLLNALFALIPFHAQAQYMLDKHTLKQKPSKEVGLILESLSGSELSDELTDQINKSILIQVTNFRGIHLILDRQHTSSDAVRLKSEKKLFYSLRTWVNKESTKSFHIKFILFNETLKRVEKKVSKANIHPDHVLNYVSKGARIVLSPLNSFKDEVNHEK